VQGVPVVMPCEAWCQLAGTLGHDELVVAGDRLLGWPRPLASAEELDEAVDARTGRRGVRALIAARADLRSGSASARETRCRLLVVRAGFPEPELNGSIELSGGTTPGDLVFREYRVLLEYDGEQHRTSDHQYARDIERLNDLALAGWLVVRVTKRTPPAVILDRLDRALRSRGWRPAS
jgi:hypothetical protein